MYSVVSSAPYLSDPVRFVDEGEATKPLARVALDAKARPEFPRRGNSFLAQIQIQTDVAKCRCAGVLATGVAICLA